MALNVHNGNFRLCDREICNVRGGLSERISYLNMVSARTPKRAFDVRTVVYFSQVTFSGGKSSLCQPANQVFATGAS